MTACKATAVTTTPRSIELLDNASGLGAPVAGACLAVAYSGGRDSTALLHATSVAAAALPGASVVALHIHHGLSAHADQWLAHAQAQCAAWAAQGLPVSLTWRKLSLTPEEGDSVEAVARDARYKALKAMADEAGADTVLLAHHRRDQAETFLLQALRGAGVAGLSGMPQEAQRHGIRWVRPWLHHPREAIEAYVRQHGLMFVEDDSNVNPRFARNRMRLAVWPALASAFEQAEASLAQAAGRAADARSCLDDWLAQSLVPLYATDSDDVPAGALDAHALLRTPLAHQRELLRHWFTMQTGRFLPASSVARMTQEMPALIDTGRSIQWRCGAFDVGLYRGLLSWRPASLAVAPVLDVVLSITATGVYPVPEWGGTLVVSPVLADGVALSQLGQVTLRSRQGGENFQLGPKRPARSLRKQFQAEAVPEWERAGPLIVACDRLIYVRGLGLDARAWGHSDEPLVTLTWVDDLTI
ncbi:MAG: tRNA lysidine(34) synthetase TilS [Burkholderiales bacterium]|nr:tRNA lysidine(34) synthetase TilS [Burkholderiales bacterium]